MAFLLLLIAFPDIAISLSQKGYLSGDVTAFLIVLIVFAPDPVLIPRYSPNIQHFVVNLPP